MPNANPATPNTGHTAGDTPRDQRIRELVDQAPPLTDETKGALSALLAGGLPSLDTGRKAG